MSASSEANSETPTGTVVEIDVVSAYALLERDPSAQLVDVRTRAEWTFVGQPVLPFRDEGPILVEWQSYPAMSVNPSFLDELSNELQRRGVPPDAPLLFLCRSGARSRAAGSAAREGGRRCFNVTEGFQGPLDEAGRRSRLSGWQASGLPWRQG